MNERPLTSMQTANIVYGALYAARMISAQRIPAWEMLRDDQKIWFSGAINTDEQANALIPGLAPISERDEAIISALREALKGK
jgi:hypothetical protein